MKIDEGYIKFNINWTQKQYDFRDQYFQDLNYYREQLHKLGLIGVYDDGIGFGNISIRIQNNEFIISGSSTGNIESLQKDHYSLVKEFDIKNNNVHCEGLTKASSESMSHAVIYEENSNINAVIHIHHQKMWEKLLNSEPTTNKDAKFGTPEMASEIQKLIQDDSGIIIMAGHEEGIITFGQSLKEAYNIIIKYYNNL